MLFYRVRQAPEIDREALFAALGERVGLVVERDHGWVCKGQWRGMPVDLFFPEHDGSSEEYRA